MRTMKKPEKPILCAQEVGNFMAFSIQAYSKAALLSFVQSLMGERVLIIFWNSSMEILFILGNIQGASLHYELICCDCSRKVTLMVF